MPKFRVRLSREVEQTAEVVVEAPTEDAVWNALPERIPEALVWQDATTDQGVQIDYVDEWADDDEPCDIKL